MHKILENLRLRTRANTSKGKQFERIACTYLKQQGLREFQHNYHSRFGEIDLIARDNGVLVFIEVRYRESAGHGTAPATVTYSKQQKLRRTALHFLQKNGLGNKMPCRFDVVGISGTAANPDIHWIKNAF